LIRLALSRKREYLADAGSVELTKDKYAMISALQKISENPVIESIQKDTVAAMCIENPFSKAKSTSFFSKLLSTHPSIEDRIKMLSSY
jgi:heat shock protein HtpX